MSPIHCNSVLYRILFGFKRRFCPVQDLVYHYYFAKFVSLASIRPRWEIEPCKAWWPHWSTWIHCCVLSIGPARTSLELVNTANGVCTEWAIEMKSAWNHVPHVLTSVALIISSNFSLWDIFIVLVLVFSFLSYLFQLKFLLLRFYVFRHSVVSSLFSFSNMSFQCFTVMAESNRPDDHP